MRLPAFVCLSVSKITENACMDLDGTLRVDRCRVMDELINFWARSGLYSVIQKKTGPHQQCSWLSIVKYSVRVMSRYFTIMYVQLIWYSKSLSVLNECRACLPDWVQACQRYQCCAPFSLFVVGRFRSFGRPSRIDLSNQSFQWSQRPPFLREFGNKPFCGIVFILPEKFNNNFIIVRERHYQLRT